MSIYKSVFSYFVCDSCGLERTMKNCEIPGRSRCDQCVCGHNTEDTLGMSVYEEAARERPSTCEQQSIKKMNYKNSHFVYGWETGSIMHTSEVSGPCKV